MAVTKGKLYLQDGSEFEGVCVGAKKSVSGEIVFQTGMTAYVEALTDPSYAGQILVLTYPLIGNYGVPSREVDQHGLLKFFESSRVQVAGVVVSTVSEHFSHCTAVQSFSDWLEKEGVPCMTGVDTRSLTKQLREHGTLLCKLVLENEDPSSLPWIDPNSKNLVKEVGSVTLCPVSQP